MYAAVRSVRAALIALVVAALAGPTPAAAQAPQKGSVEGKITFKGKPLPGGTITFHPEKAGPITATINQDGTYAARNVPAGAVKVSIETESARPKPGQPPVRFVPIPKKYAKPDTSGLTFRIVEGKQILDVVLQ
jgi:hypothetical protein